MPADHSPTKSKNEATPRFIERAVQSVQRRARTALSPWVQRSIGLSTIPSEMRARPLSASSRNTSRLIRRVQRQADSSTAVRLNLGTVQPLMVSRFTDGINNRFAPMVAKHQPAPSAQRKVVDDDANMPLADGVSRAEPYIQQSDAQTFEPFGGGFPTSDSQLQSQPQRKSDQFTSRSTVQRKAEEPEIVRPSVKDVRAILEANLAARRSAASPTAKVVNPPRPGLNQIRRVARVEEIDPVSIAARNEQITSESDGRMPSAPSEATPRRVSQRKEVGSDSDIIDSVAKPANSPNTAVQRSFTPPSDIGADYQTATPGIGRRSTTQIQRKPDDNVASPPVTNEASLDGQPPTHSTGDLSPLQRMRQARSAQLRQTQADVKPVARQNSGIDSKPVSDETGTRTAESSSRDQVKRTVRRRATELVDRPQPPTPNAGTPSAAQTSDIVDAGLIAESVQPTIRRRAVLPESETQQGTPAAPLESRVEPHVTDRLANTDKTSLPASVAPLVTDVMHTEGLQRKPVDEIEGHKQKPLTEPINDQIKPDGQVDSAVTVQSTNTLQRKLSERQAPESDIAFPPSETVNRGLPPILQGEKRNVGGNELPEVELITHETDTDFDAGQLLTLSEPPRTEIIKRKASTTSSSFEEHAIARTEKHLAMPLTQRKLVRRKAVQRTAVADLDLAPLVNNITDASPSQSESTQSTVERGFDVQPDISSAFSRSETAITAKPSTTTTVQRKPVNNKVDPSSLSPSLTLRTPVVLSEFDRSTPARQSSTMQMTLPQLREAMDVATEPGVPDSQNFTGRDFRVQRHVSPVMTRTTDANAMRMPLLKRSIAANEATPELHREPEIEIKRLSEPSSKPSLVLRSPLPAETVSREHDADVRRQTKQNAASINESQQIGPATVTHTMIQRPDIDDLALQIMPLIKRMLVVERERERGL